MDKVPPLAKWAPQELVKIYSNTNTPSQQQLDNNFPQVKDALYRLGTDIDMKACWEKLLSKEAILPKQELPEMWLISHIYSMLVDVSIRSKEVMTPQFKKKEIKKVSDLVHKLIVATIDSEEALTQAFSTVHTQLSKEIIEKNPQKSRNIGFDKAPISSWSFISGIRDVFEPYSEVQSLEPVDWDSWSDDKKASWVLGKLNGVDLISVLRVYLEQLKEIPSDYAAEYIASTRSAVTKKLFDIFHKTYGEYMPDCVVPMVNAILDLELGIEDITPYKPKEKNS
jgi:hypothetical protein